MELEVEESLQSDDSPESLYENADSALLINVLPGGIKGHYVVLG